MLDLKERTLNFAVDVRRFLKSIRSNPLIRDDSSQLVRSSGSVGANFIEAIEGFSKKDFLFRLRICLKEAKESHYWLLVIKKSNEISNQEEILNLIQESKELVRIFSAIIQKNK